MISHGKTFKYKWICLLRRQLLDATNYLGRLWITFRMCNLDKKKAEEHAWACVVPTKRPYQHLNIWIQSSGGNWKG